MYIFFLSSDLRTNWASIRLQHNGYLLRYENVIRKIIQWKFCANNVNGIGTPFQTINIHYGQHDPFNGYETPIASGLLQCWFPFNWQSGNLVHLLLFQLTSMLVGKETHFFFFRFVLLLILFFFIFFSLNFKYVLFIRHRMRSPSI